MTKDKPLKKLSTSPPDTKTQNHFVERRERILQPAEFSGGADKSGQAAPHWTVHTIGCENNRNGDITMRLSLKKKAILTTEIRFMRGTGQMGGRGKRKLISAKCQQANITKLSSNERWPRLIQIYNEQPYTSQKANHNSP